MNRNTVSALILAFATTLFAVPANAQQTRTWVSGNGSDGDPCSRFLPCKTFAGALSKTSINGEISCVDGGGYGPVTINKSVTIDCTGTYASILAGGAVGTTGVTVNIASSADDPHRSVRIRGLSINGTGSVGTAGTRTGIDGIRVVQASSVFVEDVVIGEFTQHGVEVAASANVNLTLDNVLIRNNSLSGVTLATSGGQVVASFNNVRVDGTPLGVSAAGLTRANLRNMMLAHNAVGLRTSNTDNIVNVDNMKVSFSTAGVQSSAGSTIRIANSTITQNATGLFPNGGAIVSMSGNSLTGNTTDGNFTNTQPKL
jgi:hypothetical protein